MKPNVSKPKKRLRIDSISAAKQISVLQPEKCFVSNRFDRQIFTKDYAAYLVGFISLIVTITVFVGATFAYFSDQETGAAYFRAGSININLASTTDFAPLLTPDTPASSTFNLINIGSLKSAEAFETATLSGDLDLCNNLLINVIASGTSVYNGPLVSLIATSSPLSASSSEYIIIDATLIDPSIGYINKTCNFDLVFYAWQDTNSLPDPNLGYVDRESFSTAIASGDWLDGNKGLIAGPSMFSATTNSIAVDVAPVSIETTAPQPGDSGDVPAVDPTIENPQINDLSAAEPAEVTPPEEPVEIIFIPPALDNNNDNEYY